MSGRATAVLVVAVWLCVTCEASAFVCSRVEDKHGQETGASLAWFTRSIMYTLNASGTDDIPGLTEHEVLHQAIGVWHGLQMSDLATQQCGELAVGTDVTFFAAPRLSTSTAIGYDERAPGTNENLLLFQDIAGVADPAEGSYTLALTTVTYDKPSGEIFDADIEFNTAQHAYVAGDEGPGPGEIDLMNTAVHEIGHVLGLAHSADPATTMYALAPPGDVAKRDLECDDVMGVVFKYPAGHLNNYCANEVNMACGMCAPPSKFPDGPDVVLLDPAGGLAGCACGPATAAQNGWAGWLLVLRLLGLRGRSRFSRCPRVAP